jgi:hypothetical protein
MDRRRDNLTVLFGVEVLKCFPRFILNDSVACLDPVL